MSDISPAAQTTKRLLKRGSILIALIGVLTNSTVIWLFLSGTYNYAVLFMAVDRSRGDYGDINQMTIAVALAWSIATLWAVLAGYGGGRLKAGFAFFASATILVIGMGLLSYISLAAVFSVPAFFYPTFLSLWIAQPVLGYLVARKCFPALSVQPSPERQVLMLLIGLAGLTLALSLVLALAPGIALNDWPSF